MSISSDYIIGIDLGTTNSVVAVLEGDQPRVILNSEGSTKTPSVVTFLESGEVVVGAAAQGLVDIARRRAISRAHTATHMVHKAIREALGETATQAGSENSPGRFRFDFHASGAVPISVLRDVE